MKHDMKFAGLMLAVVLAAASCGKHDTVLTVVPYPNDVKFNCGQFRAAGAEFHYCGEPDALTINAVNEFAAKLSEISGKGSTVSEGESRDGFVFVVDPALADEAYELSISKKAAVVRASSFPGFNYAIQTVKQMLPAEIYGSKPASGKDWTLPCAVIRDAPRFAYRGLHLDVSRHFFSTDEVKKIIGVMQMHKMNTLHWHLTDDQGWRLEIKKYPRLTEAGSVRKGTVVKKNWDEYDGVPYGGFYTQDEVREVIEYAEERGITIIPEIDLPGHMLAALTAYPELGCTGGPYDVWGRWGISDDVLCVGKEATFDFLEGVLEEVVELFPSEYIHIGGDECPKVRWEKCPKCQARIRELGLKGDDQFNAEHYLQSYVTGRIEEFLNGKGRKIIGWDEILEGKISPNATVMSWRGSEGGIAAVKAGHDAIMTPNTHFYFDYYQSKDVDNEPFGIGGYVPVEMVYSYEPFTDSMDADARGHILGVQANVWTEYIATNGHLEYMLLPRAAALSEVQWTLPDNKNWERFLAGLSHTAEMYDNMGCNYATHVFEAIGKVSVNNEKNCVEVTLSTQGDAPIRYTLDGTQPDENSALYVKPVEICCGCTLKAIVVRDNMKTGTFVLEFAENKALGRPVVLNSEPHPKYKYDAPGSLVDGLRGTASFNTGIWTGWYGTPVDVTIEMDGNTPYSSVTLSALIEKSSHIFNPLDLAVYISDDNVNFTEAGRAEYPAEGKDDADALKEYTVNFPETSAKYLKVTSKTVESMPEWHGARGNRGFTFIDEIIVK